jgi:hypothetical protein
VWGLERVRSFWLRKNREFVLARVPRPAE